MSLLITSRKFFSSLRNGDDFSLDTGDFATHPKGFIQGLKRADYTLQLSWESTADITNLFDYTNTQNLIERQSGSWLDDDWSIGDTFHEFQAGVKTTFEGTITNLTDLELFYSIDAGVPLTDAGGPYSDVELRGTTAKTAMVFKYGLIENDDTVNYNNAFTGTEQFFKVDGLTGVLKTATADGGEPLWKTGKLQVLTNGFISTYVQEYEIEHVFRVVPYHLEGETFGDPLGDFAGESSPTYVTNFEIRTVLSDPNTAVVAEDSLLLGNYGTYGENRNGGLSTYGFKDLVYTNEDTAIVTTGIEKSAVTKIEFTLTSDNGTLVTAATRYVFYVSKLPTDAEYTDQTGNYDEIWLSDSHSVVIGSAVAFGGIITNLNSSLIDANNVAIEVILEYSTAQQALIEEGAEFLISVSVEDQTTTVDTSDEEIVEIDRDEYVINADIPGLWAYTEVVHYPHTFEKTTAGFTDYKGWIEDGILTKFTGELSLDLDALLDSMTFRLVAFNPTTEEFFELQNFVYVFNSVFTQDGGFTTQQITLDTTRGFNLNVDDQFNEVTLTGLARSGNRQPIEGTIAWKANWQDWLALDGADTVFYDAAEENDGLNNNISRYSLKEGYEIRIFLEAGITEGNSVTTYRHKSNTINLLNRDEAPPLDPGWTATVETFNEAGTISFGVGIDAGISRDANTLYRTTWAKGIAPIPALPQTAAHRIQEIDGTFNNWELSTFRDPPPNNLLIPKDGEDFLVFVGFTANDLTFVTECLIDHTRLEDDRCYGVGYRTWNEPTLIPLPVYDITADNTDGLAAEIITDQASDPTGATDYRNDPTATTTIIVRRDDPAITDINLLDELWRFTEDNGDIIGTFDFSQGVLSGLSGALKTDIQNAFAGDVTDIPPSNIVYDKNDVHDAYNSIIQVAIAWKVTGSFLDPTNVESNLDTIDVPIFHISSRWFGPSHAKLLLASENTVVVADQSNSRVRVMTFIDNTFREINDSEVIAIIGAPQGLAVDQLDVINGQPVIYCHRFNTGQVFEMVKNAGVGWTATVIITGVGGGVNADIAIIEGRRENGKPVLITAAFGNELSVAWFDGAVWQRTLTNALPGHSGLSTCVSDSIGRFYLQNRGDGSGIANRGGNIERYIYNGNLQTDAIATVADFVNQWTGTVILGDNAASGNIDGDGATARFQANEELEILEEDSNNNPTLWIGQRATLFGSNEIFRVCTPDNISVPAAANWTVESPFQAAAGIDGHVDGTGSVVRFGELHLGSFIKSATEIIAVDQTNNNFRFIDLNSKDGSVDNVVDTVVPDDKSTTPGLVEAKAF